MYRLRFLILSFVLALAIHAQCGVAGSSAWESVKTEIRDAKSVAKDSDVEILVTPGYIIVNSPKQIDIKVFTILGRVVSAESLPPGTSRLPVTAHGVYIVKTGELTCKIAL